LDKVIFAVVCLLVYFYMISCTFFAVEIAALNGRKRGWGWLGFLLGILGIVIVCFLPNAKGVEGETNPVRVVWKRMVAVVSPLAMWIILAGLVVVVGGAFLGTRVATWVENRDHEKELSKIETDADFLTPAKVQGKVAKVFSADGSNFAVTQSGDLFGWGEVGLEALDESGKVYEKVQKLCKAGDTYYLLAQDGTLYAMGDNTNGLIPGQKAQKVEKFVKIEGDVADIALSSAVGAILKKSGNLYVVGVNTYGQLGRAAEKVSDTKQALAKDVGKVVVTERSLYYMKKDGTVCGVGNNAYGQFGLGHKDKQGAPVKISDGCKDIAAGEDFFMVLKNDGTVWTAGNNCYGQLAREPGEGKLPEGATEEDKKKLPVPAEKLGQVLELEEITRIEAAGGTAFAFAESDLYGWGHNHLGQLGKKDGDQTVPVQIKKNVADLSASASCTVLLTTDGKLLGAGDRQNYQLGSRNGGNGFREIAEVKE